MDLSKPNTTLSLRPDLAQQVGLIIAEYAVLEYHTFLLYACISPKLASAAFSEFFGLRSINRRCEIIAQAAEAIPVMQIRNAISRVIRRLKGAAQRRTEVAHCQFLKRGDGILRMRWTPTGVRYEPMNESFFARTITQFRTLEEDLIVLLGFVSGGPTQWQRIWRELPRPQGTPAPGGGSLSPDQTEQQLLDHIRACRVRLGLEGVRSRSWPEHFHEYRGGLDINFRLPKSENGDK